MGTMEPFDPERRCPKCGHDDVTVSYVRSHRSWSDTPCGATIHDHKYVEHLDRHCQRCHYIWAEAVLATASA